MADKFDNADYWKRRYSEEKKRADGNLTLLNESAAREAALKRHVLALLDEIEQLKAQNVSRVPRRVRMLTTVRSDIPCERGIIAYACCDYDVSVNPMGAVSVVLDGNIKLGLRPGEYEVIEWGDGNARNS